MEFAFSLNDHVRLLRHSGLAAAAAAGCVSVGGASPSAGLWTFGSAEIMRHVVGFVRITTDKGKLPHKPPWNRVTLKARGKTPVCVSMRDPASDQERGSMGSFILF